MKLEDKWESILHNLTRTERRRDARFRRHHALGVELDQVPVGGGDLGSDARVEQFLEREEGLLRAYFDAPKGKKRRELGRRVARALFDDELLGRDLFQHLVTFGPRRKLEREEVTKMN